jgi:hypothetical protein
MSDALTRIVRAGVPFGWGVVERAGEGTRCQLIWITVDTVSWTSHDVLPPRARKASDVPGAGLEPGAEPEAEARA